MPKEKNIAEASDPSSEALIEDAIRARAHLLFEQRGYEHGHNLDDWLQAEAELASKKRPHRADKRKTVGVA
jgi:hypothetical protein